MSELPEGFTLQREGVAVNSIGQVYLLSRDGMWKSYEDTIQLGKERSIDMTLTKEFFPGCLNKENDMIYIRRVGGRLMWIEANRMTGTEPKWKELTPNLAIVKQVESMGEAEMPEEIEKLLAESEKVETHKIGWYQDLNGNLYQFDGKEWMGNIPSRKQVETLEYLG